MPKKPVKKTVHNTNCCVFNCRSRKNNNRTIHFHHFPKKDAEFLYMNNSCGVLEKISRREAWERALSLVRTATPTMRVCSLHFRSDDYSTQGYISPRLKYTAVPSLNLPRKLGLPYVRKRTGVQTRLRSERLNRRSDRKEEAILNDTSLHNTCDASIKVEVAKDNNCNTISNDLKIVKQDVTDDNCTELCIVKKQDTIFIKEEHNYAQEVSSKNQATKVGQNSNAPKETKPDKSLERKAGPNRTQRLWRRPPSKEVKQILWNVYKGLRGTLSTTKAMEQCAFLTGVPLNVIKRIVSESERKPRSETRRHNLSDT